MNPPDPHHRHNFQWTWMQRPLLISEEHACGLIGIYWQVDVLPWNQPLLAETGQNPRPRFSEL
jgi:hypothetical protein